MIGKTKFDVGDEVTYQHGDQRAEVVVLEIDGVTDMAYVQTEDDDCSWVCLEDLTPMTPHPQTEDGDEDDLPKACECDSTHQQNDTVCRWCWAYGRRRWLDPDVPEPAPAKPSKLPQTSADSQSYIDGEG